MAACAEKNALWGKFLQASGRKLSDATPNRDFTAESDGYGYETAMGRACWPSPDPIGERGGMNLYGMVGNDGIDLVDTDGRGAFGASVGGIAGGIVGGFGGGVGGAAGGTLALPGGGTIAGGYVGTVEGTAVGAATGAILGSGLEDLASAAYKAVAEFFSRPRENIDNEYTRKAREAVKSGYAPDPCKFLRDEEKKLKQEKSQCKDRKAINAELQKIKTALKSLGCKPTHLD